MADGNDNQISATKSRQMSATESRTTSSDAKTSNPRASDKLGQVTKLPGRFTGVRFYTVAEVAAVMRVSKMSVYRMIHAGDLDAVRFGRSFRVPESAVETYLSDAYFETG